jgi:hypothetical protein
LPDSSIPIRSMWVFSVVLVTGLWLSRDSPGGPVI